MSSSTTTSVPVAIFGIDKSPTGLGLGFLEDVLDSRAVLKKDKNTLLVVLALADTNGTRSPVIRYEQDLKEGDGLPIESLEYCINLKKRGLSLDKEHDYIMTPQLTAVILQSFSPGLVIVDMMKRSEEEPMLECLDVAARIGCSLICPLPRSDTYKATVLKLFGQDRLLMFKKPPSARKLVYSVMDSYTGNPKRNLTIPKEFLQQPLRRASSSAVSGHSHSHHHHPHDGPCDHDHGEEGHHHGHSHSHHHHPHDGPCDHDHGGMEEKGRHQHGHSHHHHPHDGPCNHDHGEEDEEHHQHSHSDHHHSHDGSCDHDHQDDGEEHHHGHSHSGHSHSHHQHPHDGPCNHDHSHDHHHASKAKVVSSPIQKIDIQAIENIAQIIAQDPSSAVDHIREGNLLYINAVNKVCSSGSMDTLSPEYAEKLSRLNTDSGMNAQGFYPYFCTEAVMESLLDHARRISAKSFLELFRMRSYLACMLSILAGPDFNKTEMTTTEETNASTTSSSSSTFVSPKQLFVDLGGIELLRMPSSENINGVGGGLRSPDPAIRAIASRIMQLLMEEGKYLRCCDKCSRRETRASEFKLCAKCRFNVYCSKECQVDDWKIGGHKSLCVQL